MKKVISIFAVAAMAFGVTTFVVDSNTNEFDFLNDISTMLACDDCSGTEDDRGKEKNT
ncbi:hypothetical protein [Maribacter sp. R77961]|uniref:hypothetical protein n=1 Tax=Maribacter sp. R77961 TaxID=3093871 RepID=UPI0037C603BB